MNWRLLPLHSIFLILISEGAIAALNYNVDVALRTDPRAKDLTATVAYDERLRGTASQETPLYTYARGGVVVGGSPTLAGFVQFAPIAPLVFEVQNSTTLRFDAADRFDCQAYECQGRVDRLDYAIRGVAAYDKFFLIPSFMWRELTTSGGARPVYLEQEVFIVSPGTHRFKEGAVILGYQLSDDQQTAMMYTENEISQGHARSRTVSALYRFKMKGFVITAGFSHFKYDQLHQEGPGAFLTIDLNYGEKLGLF